MSDKNLAVPDEVHAQEQQYKQDYGCPSLAAALVEMIGLAMNQTEDERTDLRTRRAERLARAHRTLEPSTSNPN